MDFIVVRHGSHGEKIERKLYLSVYSLPEYSLVRSYVLPRENQRVYHGTHCNGIYLFTDLRDNFLIINLSKEHFERLTPPETEPSPEIHTCGIGWDPFSYVYKVVVAYRFSKIIDGNIVYQGDLNRARLYSFDTHSWTPIVCPNIFMAAKHSLYIGHVRYWIAMTAPDAEHQNRFHQFEVVSFNFHTSKFCEFPLPEEPEESDGEEYCYNVVEYGEKLGVVRYWTTYVLGSLDHPVVLWVRKGREWIKVHNFFTGPIETVLALKNKQELIIEAPCKDEDERTEVLVVDVNGVGQPRRLGVSGTLYELAVFPFRENARQLPGGQPLTKSVPGGEDEATKKKKEKKRSSTKH